VLFTSTVGWDGDQGMAELIKETYPAIKIAFVGPPVTTSPDRALNECAAIDFICRREFDFSIVEFAKGKPLNEIMGISYKGSSGVIRHNPDRAQISPEQLDDMPWATEIYHRDQRAILIVQIMSSLRPKRIRRLRREEMTASLPLQSGSKSDGVRTAAWRIVRPLESQTE
jgi:hypothetical protein